MKYICSIITFLLILSSCKTDPSNSGGESEQETKKQHQHAEHLTKAQKIQNGSTNVLKKEFKHRLDANSLAKTSDSLNNGASTNKRHENTTSWEHLEPTVQTFVRNTSEPIRIYGRKGTIVEVPAHCLKDKEGNVIQGDVSFNLKEYYSASDLIKSRMGTCSDGQLLTTGGSIDLEAFHNGEKLKISPNNPMNILFPVGDTPVNGMLPFIGIREGNSVNWIEDKGSEKDPKMAIDNTIIHYHDFDGIFCKNGLNIEQHFYHVCSPKLPTDDTSIYVAVNYKLCGGGVNDLEVMSNNCPLSYQRIIYRFFEEIDLDGNRGLANKPFCTRVQHLIKLTRAGGEYKRVKYMVAKNESRMSFIPQMVTYVKDKIITKDRNTGLMYYNIPLRNFGLLNCDAYSRDIREKTDIIVQTPEVEHSTTMIVIPSKKGVISGQPMGVNSIIKNIPIGERCFLVTMNIVEGQMLVSKKEIIIHKDHFERIKLQKVSKRRLDSYFEDIDQQFASMGNEKSSSRRIM